MKISKDNGNFNISNLIFNDIYYLKTALECTSSILQSRISKNSADSDAISQSKKINALLEKFTNLKKETTETSVGILEQIITEELTKM